MKRTMIISLFLTSIVAARGQAVPLQGAPPSGFVDPQAAEKANAHEDELYNDGNAALNAGDYEAAAGKFDQVAKMHGRKADAALYWRAYALSKAGNKDEALTTIIELKKTYPQSRYLRDAGAIEVEIRGGSVNPNELSDEETKLIALNALLNSDPEKAVPLLDKIIHGNYSPKLKEKALFVLSQSGSEKAQLILLSIAKANNDPDLQKRAIRNLGMNSNGRNRAVLKEIYESSTDPQIKKAVFQGWLMSGDKEDVLAVAKQEKSPELRREAIKYLGMMGGQVELRELYRNAGSDVETKEAVLTGMMMCGDSEGLAEIAKSEKDPKVLGKVINTLGLVGGEGTIDTLLTIYTTSSDFETKKHVINALFLHGAAKQMVAMARKETNPELKRAWIQKLSLLSGPDVTDYMMEILNK
ncbi:MAG TPA: tetratricopeptide repeat protein [Terriglobales bacterium]